MTQTASPAYAYERAIHIGRSIRLPRAAAALVIVGLALLLAPSVSYAEFRVVETANVRLIYYGQVQGYLASHVARCVENSLAFHREMFDWQPWEKIIVVMHDGSDYNNAGASTAPFNGISLAIAPPSYAFETTPANERINATMNHEMVHLVANDRTAGLDGAFRRIFFGKIRETDEHPETILYSYLTGPRRSAPRWYQEGIAVFLETWMAGGLGRALSSYDEMVFRTAVRDSAVLYDPVGLESEGTAADFQSGVNSYLYGTRFMSYLALTYGPDSLVQWVSRAKGSRSYYASQFKRVYGASLDRVWSEWIAWERDYQQGNLARIRQYPVTPERVISAEAPGSVSRGAYDAARGMLYTAVNYPGEVAYIAGFDVKTGEMHRICEVRGPALYFVTSLAYDSSTGTLFYTADNNDWRDLWSVNVDTGRRQLLQKDTRIGDLAFNDADRSLWGVRHFNGITTLVRIPAPYTEWNQVLSLPYGRDIYGIAVSPDGARISAGLSDISGGQVLVLYDAGSVMAGDSTHQVLFDFQNSIPANFTWSPGGEYLVGTSYYTGVSNIFRYNFATGEMEGGSNCETGYFSPIPVSNDSLIAFAFTGRGFIPVMIPNQEVEDIAPIEFLGQEVVRKHPVVTTWLAGSPGKIGLDSLTTYSGAYSGMRSIRLQSAYPVIEGYGDSEAYGLHLDFQDPIRLHEIDVTASYTPDELLPSDQRFHTEVNYKRSNWTASFTYNDADFYDLFGPTKTSRKGYSLGLTYDKTLMRDGPRVLSYSVNATGYTGLERLPEYQNIVTSYDEFLAFGGTLRYSNERSSLGAVDYEKGYSWRLGTNNKYVNGHLFSRFHGTFDIGTPFLARHSSIWLRHAAGFSPNEREEPLANYFFGGFGNNWVDRGAVKQYRTYYSFPGVEINEIGGVNFVRSMVEWSLPPLRFKRLGIPMLYASWARLALFTTGIVTNVDHESTRQTVGNVGGQMDIRLELLSHLRMTFSIGYAGAFTKDRKPSDELMVSLKVL